MPQARLAERLIFNQQKISDSMSAIAVVNSETLRFGWSGALFPGSRSTIPT